ncbi:DNA ligase [Clostera anachoreta granulovirus]|uniref:DNA ligase n=1 Tax=Clostera anachoreta granulovirus TaxID=283675 RepID=F4ZKY1_9BBAC|nr:DNA ligase [Clostera anachoreta granulovirus]AEB00392.1 DNA ligase [Clostera anachoreta granulovirus]
MLFSTFADIHEAFANLNSTTDFTSFVENYFKTIKERSDAYTWLHNTRKLSGQFKINDKHLLTIFCKITEPHIDRQNLRTAFKEHGVAETCSDVLRLNDSPSSLTMVDVYNFLDKLQTAPCKSVSLMHLFKCIVFKCSRKELLCLIRLIRTTHKTKRSNVKKKHAFLLKRYLECSRREVTDNTNLQVVDRKNAKIVTKPGQPIECMLAQPCKTIDSAFFAETCLEVKYDGERVQLHKCNGVVTYYKRNLNPSLKCNCILNVIQRVLRTVDNVILDCELVGNSIDDYYIVVFDVLYAHDRCLVNEPLKTRKKILNELMVNQEDRMCVIDYEFHLDGDKVNTRIREMLKRSSLDVEGVMVKDCNGTYEPKRKKWLKIRREYFENVCSADLVVVGGWRGNKNMTIYLVATPIYDHVSNMCLFLPVAKVKYSKNDYRHLMVPYNTDECKWLIVNDRIKSLKKVPDMVAVDPYSMPVWEMEGDFIRSDEAWVFGDVTHNYVSIRLPRFVRVRDDKDYRQANTIFDLALLSTISNKTFTYDALYEFFVQNNVKNYLPSA